MKSPTPAPASMPNPSLKASDSVAGRVVLSDVYVYVDCIEFTSSRSNISSCHPAIKMAPRGALISRTLQCVHCYPHDASNKHIAEQ